MGIFQYLFDNGYLQRNDIERLKTLAQRRSLNDLSSLRVHSELRARVAELENEVGELALLCRSLLTYLREAPDWSNDRFYEILKRIDAADGVVDGNVTKAPTKPKPKPLPRRRAPG